MSLLAAAPPVFAQAPQIPTSSDRIIEPIPEPRPQRQFSFVNAGVFVGRSGAANGPSGVVEFDPIRWFGFGVFASESSGADNNMYGGRAYGGSLGGETRAGVRS